MRNIKLNELKSNHTKLSNARYTVRKNTNVTRGVANITKDYIHTIIFKESEKLQDKYD